MLCPLPGLAAWPSCLAAWDHIELNIILLLVLGLEEHIVPVKGRGAVEVLQEALQLW